MPRGVSQERIYKLPQWAQLHINHQNNYIDMQKKKLDEQVDKIENLSTELSDTIDKLEEVIPLQPKVSSPSSIKWGDYTSKGELPTESVIKILLPNQKHPITVSLERTYDGSYCVEVAAEYGLEIIPHSNTTIFIRNHP